MWIEEVGWLEKGVGRREVGMEGEWSAAKGKQREGELASAEKEPYGCDLSLLRYPPS